MKLNQQFCSLTTLATFQVFNIYEWLLPKHAKQWCVSDPSHCLSILLFHNSHLCFRDNAFRYRDITVNIPMTLSGQLEGPTFFVSSELQRRQRWESLSQLTWLCFTYIHTKMTFCSFSQILSQSLDTRTMIYFLGYISSFKKKSSLTSKIVQFTDIILVTKKSLCKYLGILFLLQRVSAQHTGLLLTRQRTLAWGAYCSLKKKKNNFKAKGSLFFLGVSFFESLFIDFPCNSRACKL